MINFNEPILVTFSNGQIFRLNLDSKIPSHKSLMDALEKCANEKSFPDVKKFESAESISDGRGGIDRSKLTARDTFLGI